MFYPDVVNALFRRVPGKVEAENYGHEGLNVSYFVKDTSTNSKYYRTSEPVPVELVERSGQAIQLSEGEWTQYTVNSVAAKTYAVTVKARAESAPAVIQTFVNGVSEEMTVDDTNWTELKFKPVSLSTGTNQVKLSVTSGLVGIDWVGFQ